METPNTALERGRVFPWWMIWMLDNPLRRMMQNPDELLSGLVKPGQTVVDIGCGAGFCTITLAKLVGENGQVIAVDLQKEMLSGLINRMKRAGLDGRVRPHLCRPNTLALMAQADFALAFHMLHEVPNPENTLREIRYLLKPGGRFLLVEPQGHVSQKMFDTELEMAQGVGLRLLPAPDASVGGSRTALFKA